MSIVLNLIIQPFMVESQGPQIGQLSELREKGGNAFLRQRSTEIQMCKLWQVAESQTKVFVKQNASQC